jgi:hypothetical protein
MLDAGLPAVPEEANHYSLCAILISFPCTLAVILN